MYRRFEEEIRGDNLIRPTKPKNEAEKKLGVSSITWDKSKELWRLRIKINNKTVHIRYFKTIEEATNRKNEELKKP